MTKFDQSVRGKVRKRDGWQCRFCRCRVYNVVPPWAKAWTATFDHLVPRWRGGTETVENMVVACKACNETKSGENPVGKWAPKGMPVRPLAQLAWPGDVKAWRPAHDDLSKVNAEDEKARSTLSKPGPLAHRTAPLIDTLPKVS